MTVPSPEFGADLDDWWEDEVWPETGDGHGSDLDLDAFYVATIIAADDPTLVGKTREWD